MLATVDEVLHSFVTFGPHVVRTRRVETAPMRLIQGQESKHLQNLIARERTGVWGGDMRRRYPDRADADAKLNVWQDLPPSRRSRNSRLCLTQM